jgi:2',3'-cyclic-nucleotide 2'-phosphodiesterase (5'-nucleotidase family)
MMVVLVMVLSLFTSAVSAKPQQAPASPVTFTILHTNDFHGNLEWKSGGSSSNPGSARVSAVVNGIRSAVGPEKVLLLDAGDEMQGSLLSNIQEGEPTIAVYNQMGYNAATFGNHEFDWGQDVLKARVDQANYPYVSANIVVNDTGNCSTAGWTTPDFAQPYVIQTIGTDPNAVKVAIIGVTTPEVPIITVASATAGLCFKDPVDAISRNYDAMKAAADVIVVLSHLGYPDGGYGYGIPIYGDQTLATKLNTLGKPVNLIIGGHSHTSLATATVVGSTSVVQAAYNGRRVGRADITVDQTGKVAITWSFVTTPTAADAPVDQAVADIISAYSNDPVYQTLINQEIGWTNVPITRNYDGDSLMGYFVNDAIYNDLNSDAVPTNDVDMVFNNPGGLRADIVCAAYPCKMTYGMLYSVLPFGNQTVVGDMTGEAILELLNQSASLSKGAIQTSGIRYKFYNYRVDLNPDPAPAATNYKAWAWGAFDAEVLNKTTGEYEPLDLNKTYHIATNEFLAPAGQDNFYAFKYVTNISYLGDMLDGVNRWVGKTFTAANPYNGALDGRITRDGDDTSGSIIPITVLHHNDMHGNLYKGSFVGYTQLATVIKQEMAYNPNRTLLLNSGDNIQGDGFSFYFKSAPLGYAADGTTLEPALQTNPIMAAMNTMPYDAMTLGNHEYNFGSQVFTSVLEQANFPILQANVADDGQYGIAKVPVLPYVETEREGIKIAILGIGNHRIPNYELPSNIPGLTFSDPLLKAQELTDQVGPENDIVIALTHIGFTEDPKSVEVDKNVDTNMAKTVTGLDAIIGGHSHTNPASGFGATKYLPTYVLDPNGVPVIINQAYRYNNTLGELFIGVRPKAGGGYEVVSRAGQYISVPSSTAEDATIKTILNPYIAKFTSYNNQIVGKTTVAIDALQAYTQETNGANLQADAALYELETKNGIPVDFHLSGAMSNRAVATSGPYPKNLAVADMFTLMPYENSLVVMEMNGPQIKAVLERAYRNYYYYKYVPNYGGYSYYTTCMIDTDHGNQIVYNDLYPAAYDPAKNYVVSFKYGNKEVDFTDAKTYYRVSTVNYLAAGSCNFNDAGKTLWPLNQIVADTQYYVRDAVIDYLYAMGTVSPAIEGRLQFITDVTPPVITINAPHAGAYMNSDLLTIDFTVTDDVSGVKTVTATLDGKPVADGDVINLNLFVAGSTHNFAIEAMDMAYNASSQAVSFTIKTSVQSMKIVVTNMYNSGTIKSKDVYMGLMDKLNAAEKAKDIKTRNNNLIAFVNLVKAQSGKAITTDAANLLIADAQWLMLQPLN